MSSNRPRAAQFGALGFAAVALGCAGFAAYLVGKLLHDGGYSGEKVRPVVVAKRALPAAEPLAPDALEVVQWPESAVPEGAVGDVAALFPAGQPAPVPTTGILAGEPIVPSRLAAPGQGTGLAALLRPGYRAVAVKVDDAVGRAGLVYPGAHVDILATIRDPEGRGPSTRIAVENARVLAVELETDVATRRPRKQDEGGGMSSGQVVDGTVVTLEVAPADAEIVSLARREGQVDLALRNGSDDEPGGTRGATPVAFSAFAPAPVAADGAMAQAAPPPIVVAPADSGRAGRRGAGSGRRRIEIRASDDADKPARTGGGSNSNTIETYHAQ